MTGAELRALREALGWSQQRLAEAVGRKSDRTVHRWEAGTVPVPLLVERYILEGCRKRKVNIAGRA